MKRRETVKWEDGKVHFKKSLEADEMVRAISGYGELVNPRRNKAGRLYLGSIDPITAANWARESGTKIGTKEFVAYAKKKLLSGEFAKYQAPKERLYF